MHITELSHHPDGALRRDMIAALANERRAAAASLAHIAEFDARKLFLPEGYPSMFRFCIDHLGLSEAGASKCLQAARTAREFPAIWDMLADGRLSASTVCLLASRLTDELAADLLAAAAHRPKRALEQYLANRFPKGDLAMEVTPLELAAAPSRSPGNVSAPATARPACAATPAQRPQVAPPAPERYSVRFTMGQATHEAMRAFEKLAGRRVTAEQMNEALRRGFVAMRAAIEKKRFAATDRPRKQNRTPKGRHIPAAVKREVWRRDEGRCTFVAESGRRCDSGAHLEFDHIEPVARGGCATVENLRLRCRAHNQYEAEQVYGAGFMQEKRERARKARARPGQAGAPGVAPPHAAATDSEPGPAPSRSPGNVNASAANAESHDVTPWLRRLGYKAGEAKEAAAYSAQIDCASLEEHVRAALAYLRPPARTVPAPRDGQNTGLRGVSA
jgi:5-methylcytosine-specific restriction endonuclease McrA